jgi:hypothetical protein
MAGVFIMLHKKLDTIFVMKYISVNLLIGWLIS